MKNFFKLKTFNIVFLFLVVLILVTAGIIFFTKDNYKMVRAGSGDNVSGFAWSENVGWISFNSTDCFGVSECDDCPGCIGTCLESCAFDYGVTIDQGTGNFSGYAWSGNVGWVSFNRKTCNGGSDNGKFCVTAGNCADSATCDLNGPGATGNPPGEPYSSGEDFIADYDGSSQVTGWAKIESLGDDGWIKMRKDAGDSGGDYGISIDSGSGDFSGWAWNGNDTLGVGIGWISFNSTNCDTDGDGLSEGVGECPTAGTPISDYEVNFGGGGGAIGVPVDPTNVATSEVLLSCSGASVPVTVSWIDNSTNEIGFEVYRSLDRSDWSQEHCRFGPYAISDLESSESSVLRSCVEYINEGTQYYFRVQAIGEGGNSGWAPSDNGISHLTGYCPPSLSATSKDCNTIDLSWTYGGGGNYDISRRKDAGAWDDAFASGVIGNTYTDTTDILPDSTYEYRITALGPPVSGSNETTAITPCPTLPTWQER